MSRLRLSMALATGAVLVTLLAAPHGAAHQPPSRAPIFGVDVPLVAVPVFVTNKQGQAVQGLTAVDFEVEEDGRNVPIRGFLAVDAGASGVAPVAQGPMSPVLQAASRRQFLLLFDLTFSDPRSILKARQAALGVLAREFQPGDLVAVARFGSAGVAVDVAFTTDRTQAARAVASLQSAEGVRLRDPLGMAWDLGAGAQLLEATGSWGLQMSDEETKAAILQMARADRELYRQRVMAFVGQLQGLGQLLDSVQGRKQVVLISAGFDQSLLAGAGATERAENARAVTEGRLWDVQADRHFGDATARGALDAVFQTLARSDTVVHTVSVSGLAAGAPIDERAFTPQGSGQETLALIASGSGGRFVRQTNDLAGALREVLDASRHYYVLAFEPPASKRKAGEPRRIRIKVDRPGVEVSHRMAYALPVPGTAAAARARQFEAAEVIAKGLTGGVLRLDVLAVPYRNVGGRVSLPVVLEVDGQDLLAGGAKEAISLEIYGYALDGNGRILDALVVTPTLELARVGASLREKGLQLLTSFRVAEGPVDLRFLVREPATGRGGSLRVIAPVPRFEPGASLVSVPLLMVDPRGRLVLPTPSRAQPELEIPFRVEQTPFTPQAAAVLRNGEPRQVCLMVFGGPPPGPVGAVLVGEGGRTWPLSAGTPRLVSDADGTLRLVVRVIPSGAPGGEYRLRVSLGDQDVRAPELPVRVE